jgi:hypothetical protein
VASLQHLELYLSGFLIIGMVAFIEVGYRIGRRALARDPRIVSEVAGGIGTMETVVFGLLGLTLAFTFSGVSDRLAVRRAQIVQEAIIIALLVTLAFLGAVLSGYTMALQGKRNAMRITVFAVAIAATIYVVLDLEFPRAGLINLTSIDRAIVQLRELMK